MGLSELLEQAAGNVKHSLAKSGWIKPPFEEADAIATAIPNDADYDTVMRWWQGKCSLGLQTIQQSLVGFDTQFIYELLSGHDNSIIGISQEEVGKFIWEGVPPTSSGNILNNAKTVYDMVIADALRGSTLSTDLIHYYHKQLTVGELYDSDRGAYRGADMTEGISYRNISSYMEKSIKQSAEFLDFNQTKNYVLLAASYTYCMICKILPYVGFNDMVAKFVLNFILVRHHLPPTCVFGGDVHDCKYALNEFIDKGQIIPFMQFVQTETKKTWNKVL